MPQINELPETTSPTQSQLLHISLGSSDRKVTIADLPKAFPKASAIADLPGGASLGAVVSKVNQTLYSLRISGLID